MCNETTEALVCENLFDEVNLTISRFNMMLDQYYTAFCGDISSHLREVLDVQISTLETHLVSLSGIKCQLENEIKKTTVCVAPLGVGQGGWGCRNGTRKKTFIKCAQKYPLLKTTNQKRLFTLDQEKKKPFFLSKIHKD